MLRTAAAARRRVTVALRLKRVRLRALRSRRSISSNPATFSASHDIRFPAFHFDLERFDRLRIIDPAARTDPSPNRRHRSVNPLGTRSYFQPGRHAYRLTIPAIILLSLMRFSSPKRRSSNAGTCLGEMALQVDSFALH
jgi:hypothetical protein